ncbi:hypothetical protein [Symbiobacterium thermophilum]|uniref:hypothetical protein n=1 Tax=Symbiobacterium thermophilum TaxID=2734 RepID=UPI0035C68CA5
MEEGYVRGVSTFAGLVKVDHSENDRWRPESARRIFVAPEEARRLHPHWNRMLERALSAALALGPRRPPASDPQRTAKAPSSVV